MRQNRRQLPLSFREAEISQILRWVQAGESASVIGMSGVGKSNLFNHLLDPAVQQHYLDDSETDYLFLRVNFHLPPDFTDRSIYSLILEQLEFLDGRATVSEETISAISQKHEALLDSADDPLKVQYYFKTAVRQLMRKSNRHLVLLCDQFDDIYKEGGERLFANLRGLREAYKYRLSYIVFTRDVLSHIRDLDPAREEFHELLASNQIPLAGYSRSDAANMLARIAARHDLAFDEQLERRLYDLTAGHAGLLRALFLALVRNDSARTAVVDQSPDAISLLLQNNGVTEECEKLWGSCNFSEQAALVRQQRGWELNADQEQAIEWLRQKGMLVAEEGGLVPFCPVYQQFVSTRPGPWDQPLWLDKPTGEVWLYGNTLKPDLTDLEFKLLQALYERRNEICTHEYIIRTVWPDEYDHTLGDLDNQRIVQLVARLRKRIEPKDRKVKFIENVRGRGYRLKLPDA